MHKMSSNHRSGFPRRPVWPWECKFFTRDHEKSFKSSTRTCRHFYPDTSDENTNGLRHKLSVNGSANNPLENHVIQKYNQCKFREYDGNFIINKVNSENGHAHFVSDDRDFITSQRDYRESGNKENMNQCNMKSVSSSSNVCNVEFSSVDVFHPDCAHSSSMMDFYQAASETNLVGGGVTAAAFTAQAGVLYTNTLQTLYKHPTPQVDAYMQSCLWPHLLRDSSSGGSSSLDHFKAAGRSNNSSSCQHHPSTAHCSVKAAELRTANGAALSVIAPRKLDEVERQEFINLLVAHLNSEPTSTVCLGLNAAGRVVGTAATPATLARFVRGVLNINEHLILPHITAGGESLRCGVRCVPVRGIVTRELLRDVWVIEVLLTADQEYYNPYNSSSYWYLGQGGSVNCVPFDKFCQSIIDTTTRRVAPDIQRKFTEIAELEEQLRALELQQKDILLVEDGREVSCRNLEERDETRDCPTFILDAASRAVNQDGDSEAADRKVSSATSASAGHLCERCWLRDCPIDAY
ncbi:uncharacterized protein LOC108680007 isoform X2 [Hyalella azteca]|uniref:Uncharacterized protein LOC108680007 isoform X2 n=1 Tax=Hyalella azteca TaxID=294128 RepID=A0A8B7PDN5_HYAAZ|nr:uncharacterized protein LOC108680007 isoform X2 [Hyalella azteca]